MHMMISYLSLFYMNLFFFSPKYIWVVAAKRDVAHMIKKFPGKSIKAEVCYKNVRVIKNSGHCNTRAIKMYA